MVNDPPKAARSRAEAKRLTRMALLEAGLTECGERGLDSPSLDAICARAGYTRGAFYVHFKDREDFLVALMEWALSSIVDALLGRGDGEPLAVVADRLATAVSRGRWPLASGGGLTTTRLVEALERSEAVRARCADLLQSATLRLTKLALRGQESADIRRDVTASQIAHLIVTLVSGAVVLRLAGLPVDADALRVDMATLLGSAGAG